MQYPGSPHGRAGVLWVVALLSMYALLCGIFAANCPAAEAIGPQLQRVSVNVLAGNSQGSGTIFLSTVEGEPAAFILTANHVIDGLREVTSVISVDGSTRKVVRYADAAIIQERVIHGRVIGEVKYASSILSVDSRRDIALLRVRRGDFTTEGSSFYLGETIPAAGSEIYRLVKPVVSH